MTKETTMYELRYPIGQYKAPTLIDKVQRDKWIKDIATLPARFRDVVSKLTPEQLDTPYRPGGWTVRQLAHHVPDSHLHSMVRFKWALTEDKPLIKAYNEQAWAELADYKEDIAVSLNLLETIHARWIVLLNVMTEADYAKSFMHPETGKEMRLDFTLGMYAWHGNHHLAHITKLIEREGW